VTGALPSSRYIVEVGPGVLVPIRIAAMLNAYLKPLRIKMRGHDSELDQVLLDFARIAMTFDSSERGTIDAPTPEPRRDLSEWVTTSIAADIIGITERAVRRAIAERRISAQKLSGGWCLTRQDVEQFRAARTAA
jgi:excisionase family DNA binding protein